MAVACSNPSTARATTSSATSLRRAFGPRWTMTDISGSLAATLRQSPRLRYLRSAGRRGRGLRGRSRGRATRRGRAMSHATSHIMPGHVRAFQVVRSPLFAKMMGESCVARKKNLCVKRSWRRLWHHVICCWSWRHGDACCSSQGRRSDRSNVAFYGCIFIWLDISLCTISWTRFYGLIDELGGHTGTKHMLKNRLRFYEVPTSIDDKNSAIFV
jgi:hypothetical protein